MADLKLLVSASELLILMCSSFLPSQPFYFSCIIQLLSFLSPFFITTSLASLSAFLSFSSILQGSSIAIANNIHVEENHEEEHVCMEDLDQMFKMVFASSTTTMAQVIYEGNSEESNRPTYYDHHELGDEAKEKTKMENFLKILVEFEKMDDDHESNFSGFMDSSEFSREKTIRRGHNSAGSMRKEREWRRTLACKLFEERRSSSMYGGEGMDSLWEKYDQADSAMTNSKPRKKQKKKTTKNITDTYNVLGGYDHFEQEHGQICCLQALKLSAWKMNLGHVGKHSLVRISKVVKGFGWLNKHSKKVHNSGDRY